MIQRINCELIITPHEATLVLDEFVENEDLLRDHIRGYNKGKFLLQQRPYSHKKYNKLILSLSRKFISFIEKRKW